MSSRTFFWFCEHAGNAKLRSSARILTRKAASSLRVGVVAFNGVSDEGRSTTVLLHLQHAFEMVLKSGLNQKRVPVFDKKTGRSMGFESAIRQAQQTDGIKLTDEEAGTLRAIDAMRDDEQHWYNEVGESPILSPPDLRVGCLRSGFS